MPTDPDADEAVQEVPSEDLELDVGGNGGSSSSIGGGVRGVVAVLDDGQEMDRCSCDLVKVSFYGLNMLADPLRENYVLHPWVKARAILRSVVLKYVLRPALPIPVQ